MFDSMPNSQAPVAGKSREAKVINRLARYRRHAQLDNQQSPKAQPEPTQTAAVDEKTIAFVGLWNADNDTLRDCIEMVSDWGPFELADISSAFRGDDGDRRVLCRFIYHGPPKDYDYFAGALKASISKVTYWEPASDA